MKKYSFIVLAVLAFAVNVSFAKAPATSSPAPASSGGMNQISPNQGSDSCGLGWQVTQSRTMIGTTTRGTTNGVIHPSFGMTSGTMGCETHAFAKNDRPAADFAIANFDALSVDVARGNGEYLQALVRTLGCSDASVTEIGTTLQSQPLPQNGVELFYRAKLLAGQCSA